MRLPTVILAGVLAIGIGEVRAQDVFNLDETVATCAECHGAAGVPADAEVPILWGQEFYYFYVQLKDFSAGRRANDIMQPIAAQFDKDQMKALAQYFTDQPWPDSAAHDSKMLRVASASTNEAAAHNPTTIEPAAKARAQRLLVSAQCSGCHNTFMGDSRLPRVAGQQYGYLYKTMLELRDNVRRNAAAMQALMDSLTDQDLEDLARYLAAL